MITGSAGHLGEALVRTFKQRFPQTEVISIDVLASPFTTHQGSIVDADLVERCMAGVDTVIHPATLHKPHVATHSRQDFVDTNITGTLNLLEAAVRHKVARFIFTSTTSTFGHAMGKDPSEATWITEDVVPIPKNIYGLTKIAAENMCALFHQKFKLPVLVLRTSRFFPEEDDNRNTRDAFSCDNTKLIEYLYRRVDIEDVVEAHLCALERAEAIGFDTYIISATTPFTRADLVDLKTDPAKVVQRVADYGPFFKKQGWRMFPSIDRVYVNTKAREALGWTPRYDFQAMLARLQAGDPLQTPLAQVLGKKGYHKETFEDGPFPVD
nr:NAD(P)-dependent oxidoreductase [Acanthopleuribacter pedis]